MWSPLEKDYKSIQELEMFPENDDCEDDGSDDDTMPIKTIEEARKTVSLVVIHDAFMDLQDDETYAGNKYLVRPSHLAKYYVSSLMPIRQKVLGNVRTVEHVVLQVYERQLTPDYSLMIKMCTTAAIELILKEADKEDGMFRWHKDNYIKPAPRKRPARSGPTIVDEADR